METNSSQRFSLILSALVLVIALFVVAVTPETDTYNPISSFLDHMANFDAFLAVIPTMIIFSFVGEPVIQVLKKLVERLSFVPDWRTVHIKIVVVLTIWVLYFFVQEYQLFGQFEFYWPRIEQLAVVIFGVFGTSIGTSMIYKYGKARDEPWARSRTDQSAA